MSSSVRSGSTGTRKSSHCSCLFSGERLWPVLGLASTSPVVVQRSTQRIAVEAPIQWSLFERWLIRGGLGAAFEEPCYKGSIERPFCGSEGATCSAFMEACCLSCSQLSSVK